MAASASGPQQHQAKRRRFRPLFASALLGAVFVGLVGWMLAIASLELGQEGTRRKAAIEWLWVGLAEYLARLGYDLPFSLRGPAPAPLACLVYLDEHSARALGQNGNVWDRSLHARLVRRLTASGARAILFDVVFSDSSADPVATADLAQAIQENSHVFLGAALELDAGYGAEQQRVIAPLPALRRAASGWGLLSFYPIDADYGVRRIFTGLEHTPSAVWRAAVLLGASLPDTAQGRAEMRWMNYYGPANSFPSVDYDRALYGVTDEFFRGRIVCIGSRPTLNEVTSNNGTLGKDSFRNPYSLLGGEFSNGAEVHLTALLNLINGQWLTRLSVSLELGLILALGFLLGGLLPLVRPHVATLLAGLAMVGLLVFSVWLLQSHRLWWAWSIPAFVQTPLALIWSLGVRYFLEARHRNRLRQAFAHYLSPQMADRIAAADFDLTPGGVVVEATVMITDLEGFTPLSEQLHHPEMVSKVLTQYFTQTARHILDHDGTIIHFVGDALCAVWGAPMSDPEHPRKAVRAAWMLHQAAQIEAGGHLLKTRLGLHTGRVLAGNLGSAERFDYAVIGDTVNFASRLEGLNKQLGTDVLISDQLQQRLGNEFLTRCVGAFRVVGKQESRVIHELLGVAATTPPMPWLDSFAEGLEAFRAGAWDRCEASMQTTRALRGGDDGPANFYLEQLTFLKSRELPENWTGIVQMMLK